MLLSVLAAACNDSPSAPQHGTLRVAIVTTGGDQDVDGYDLVVDGLPQRVTGDAAQLPYMGVGTHTVTLEGVAATCGGFGTPQRAVAVKRNQTVDVTFLVVCETTGIAITTETSGVNSPELVDVFVDRDSFGPTAASGLMVAGRLQPGKHTVTLVLPGINCSVAGGSSVTVDVLSRTVTPVRFEVTCAAPVRSEKIAFVADTTIGGSTQTLIEMVDPDGSGSRVLGSGGSPAWSPDGTSVAFTDARCALIDDEQGFGCSGGLSLMDPELGSLTRPIYVGRGFSPAFAPAGDSIALVECCVASHEPGRLFIVGIDPWAGRELFIPQVRSIRDPAWSPDGRHIAFGCIILEGVRPEQPNEDICVVDRDGSGFQRLTAEPTSESSPAWSPDGRRIAFTRGAEIALLTLDDGTVTRLTDGREPAWSPDGAMLVFAGGDGLFVINADGSNRRRLTTGAHSAPAWRP